MATFLIYGANGYTGTLVAREAVAQGLRPVLAGRSAPAVRELAERLALEHRVFALDDARTLDEGLAGMSAVLHCAGPFAHTSRPMADACLRTGTHYLDITGEIAVFEALAARDAEAKARGVLLLPGVGFDVVPTDCLAAHLKRRLPGATHLTLAFASSSRVSRGTATTALEKFACGGMVRQDGELRRVPLAWKTRTIDFGSGPKLCITIPWGDVFAAYHSTGIPNVEVYMAVPPAARVAAKLLRPFGWLIRLPWVQELLKKRIRAGPPGPTDEERARGWSVVWGEVRDDHGGKAAARLRGPEGYTFTALAAVAAVRHVLAGPVRAGFQTPSRAFGPDFALEVPGVQREDL